MEGRTGDPELVEERVREDDSLDPEEVHQGVHPRDGHEEVHKDPIVAAMRSPMWVSVQTGSERTRGLASGAQQAEERA